MTLLASRATSIGGEPSVDLMPPVLASKVKAKGMLRWLVLAVLLAVLLAVAATMLALQRETSARADLTRAEERTTQLLTERAGYAEVTAALATEDALTQATQFAGATELLWSDVYEAIDARLPDTTTIDGVTFAGRAPWEAVTLPESTFRLPREATVTLTVTSTTAVEPADLIDRLTDIPGFADATPSTVTEGEGLYETIIVMHLGADALSGRLSATGEEVQP